MGSPELPNDQNSECIRPSGLVLNTHIRNGEDSDNEQPPAPGDNTYEGYEQLQMVDNEMEASDEDGTDDDDDDDDDDENMEGEFDNGLSDIASNNVVEQDNPISVDAEIQNEIWNTPRPSELVNIELDSTRTEQILTAMAGIQLPNLAIPQWAQGVPEERWKEDLLQRIRQRQTTDLNSP